jgi:antitoxin HicB
MMFYRVDLEPDDNGTIMASFPDVPGAITYGDTAEEALEHATDALLTVFDALMRDKKDLPRPAAKTSGVGITIPALEASKLIVYRNGRSDD